MPNYRNDTSLPIPVYRSITDDMYSKGSADFSVTELLKPHWQAYMEYKFIDDVELDVFDNVSAWIGNSVHDYLLGFALDVNDEGDPENPRYMAEERLYTDILGCKIGGKADLYDIKEQHMYDYKTTSVYSYQYGTNHDEWEKQLNMLAYIWRKNNHPVTKLSIIAIYKDWRPSEAEREPKYPTHQIVEIPVEMWSDDKVREYMEGRVRGRLNAMDGKAYPCSAEECWSRPAKWAVKQVGKDRAVKLFDREEDARLWAAAAINQDRYTIEYRPGRRIKCESYCPVRSKCQLNKA